MDLGIQHSDEENGFEEDHSRPRPLPDDLPKSLDDRQPIRHYGGETEMYDAWQGIEHSSVQRLEPYENNITHQPCRPVPILDKSNPRATSCLQSFPRRQWR